MATLTATTVNGTLTSTNTITSGGAFVLPGGFTIDHPGSGYGRFNSWVRLDGHYGLYSGTNGAHIYPNNGTYGSWRMDGTRNSWQGIEFGSGNNGAVVLMVNPSSNTTGFHNNSYGWQFYWESGSLYVLKNAYGGGAQATVLDSSNYNSYAPTLTGTGASGTWGINITGNSNTASSTQRLDDVNNYTWSISTLPTSYPEGMQLSFVGPNAGEGNWQNYGTVINARTYAGGGGSLQIYVPYGPNNGGSALQVRFGDYSAPTYGNQWTAWKTLLQSDNYNSYAPTLTGGGASGTWSISISGNASTSTTANVAKKIQSDYQEWDFSWGSHTVTTPMSISIWDNYVQSGAPSSYGTLIDMYGLSGHQQDQFYFYQGTILHRYGWYGNNNWNGWYRVLTSNTDPYAANMNQYVRTTDTVAFGKLDVNYSGSNVNGIASAHTGSLGSGQVAQAFSAGWSAYGASFVIVYKQGELSPSDMCSIYNVGGFYMKIYDGTSNRYHRWDDNGSVSINSSSQGSYIFNVTGDIYATADVIAFSDARVKEDVRTVENALDKVSKLRGVTYIKKDEDNKKRKMGVIAQEVLEVLPEVVHEDNDGYYGVSYGNIVGVLIEAIKEQQKQIDELKQELKNK